MEDFLRFLWAVANNWAGYTTGGLVVALLWLWSTLKQVPISRKTSIAVAVMFLIFAFFNAWRGQYLRTKSGLKMQVHYVATANPMTG
jgi:hypothetical protein